MLHSLLSGWALGLATGTTCLGTCAPIYIPYLIAEKRTGKQSFSIVLQITVGRFISYIAFGAVFGFVGSRIPVLSRELFTALAYIMLSIYLVASVFRIRRHSSNCKNIKIMNLTKNPFILGILTGVSFCPAFLIAISNAIDISGVSGGITLFAGFFLGTSVFILPISFLGALSNLDKIRKIAQISAILIAAYFIYKGTDNLINFYSHNSQHLEESDNQKAKPFLESENIYIFTDTDIGRWDPLIHSLENDSIKVIPLKSAEIDKISKNGAILTTITEAKIIEEDVGYKVIKIELENFKNDQDFKKLQKFLTDIYFRYDPEKGYSFKIENPPGGIAE